MQKALAPEISTWPDENPQLIGSSCGDCGATTFPVQQWCPRCSGAQMSELLLPRRGSLVAWTTQGFACRLARRYSTEPLRSEDGDHLVSRLKARNPRADRDHFARQVRSRH